MYERRKSKRIGGRACRPMPLRVPAAPLPERREPTRIIPQTIRVRKSSRNGRGRRLSGRSKTRWRFPAVLSVALRFVRPDLAMIRLASISSSARPPHRVIICMASRGGMPDNPRLAYRADGVAHAFFGAQQRTGRRLAQNRGIASAIPGSIGNAGSVLFASRNNSKS